MNMSGYHDLERISQSASVRAARITLWMGMLGLLALGSWSAVAQIDQVTRSRGQVVAVSRTQVIQAANNGVLRALFVQEGDRVEADQLLGTLDKDRAQAAVDDSQAKVAAQRVRIARLRAEIYNTPLAFDVDIEQFPELINNQKALYQKRRKAFKDNISALKRVRSVVTQELMMNKKLELSQDVSHAEILKLERQVAEINAQIINKQNQFFQDAQSQMAKAQETLNAEAETLNDRLELLQNTDLIAPMSGIVKNISVTTLGGVLRNGDIVMEILPTSDDLVVEAKVPPQDVAFVQIGQQAAVKLDAWDYSIYGGFIGEVTYVSADTLDEQTPQGPAPYYRVHITIGEREFNHEQTTRMKIRAGMTAEVDIRAGKRRVLSYLTNPISKLFTQAFKEL